uniref:Uncharacterized protein n=1 Tax=Psilocybe cubensis TaxID=181762 RepID=A0A8H7XW67_PSICU
MADPPSPYNGFMTMSLEDRFALLFRAQQVRFDADKKVDDQLSAIESKLERLTASLPKPPAAPTPSARAPRARHTSRKERPAAPTSTPTTGPPHSQSIRSTTTKAALEKIVSTLSIADEQAGHVIGRYHTPILIGDEMFILDLHTTPSTQAVILSISHPHILSYQHLSHRSHVIPDHVTLSDHQDYATDQSTIKLHSFLYCLAQPDCQLYFYQFNGLTQRQAADYSFQLIFAQIGISFT